jgi:hypothetical protein
MTDATLVWVLTILALVIGAAIIIEAVLKRNRRTNLSQKFGVNAMPDEGFEQDPNKHLDPNRFTSVLASSKDSVYRGRNPQDHAKMFVPPAKRKKPGKPPRSKGKSDV